MNLVKKAGLGVVLAATTLTAVAPAEAQRWRGRNRGGDVAAGAVLGGIVGLGLGAAIASSNRDRYYDRGYAYDGYYAQPQRNYYYDDRRYRRDWRRCFNERRVDYYGRPYRVRVCR
jgi:hypothetical protein